MKGLVVCLPDAVGLGVTSSPGNDLAIVFVADKAQVERMTEETVSRLAGGRPVVVLLPQAKQRDQNRHQPGQGPGTSAGTGFSWRTPGLHRLDLVGAAIQASAFREIREGLSGPIRF